MLGETSGSNVGSCTSKTANVLLTATVDAPYFTATDTVAATSVVVEKKSDDAVRVHSPMPLVASGEVHVTSWSEDTEGTSMVMVSVRLLVDTRVRPAASCT